MNLPNKLTVARLVLTMIFVAVLSADFAHSKSIALALFVVASITDFLDGYIARKYDPRYVYMTVAPGFEAKDCPAVTGDNSNHRVCWKGGSIGKLKNRTEVSAIPAIISIPMSPNMPITVP